MYMGREKRYNKLSRVGLSTILLVIMLLTTIIPVWANEVPVPDISEWAILYLNEGEKYGIYPIEWYYDGFRNDITQEKVELLLTNTNKKLEILELEKNDDFVAAPIKGDATRGDFLTRLYNIIGQYDLDVGNDPIEYMVQRGILKGSLSGLDLDKVCTTEQAVVFSTRVIKDTYDLLEAGSKGLAWKVENNGNTVYFLGSIHIGENIAYPINGRIMDAFNESNTLLVEANLFDQTGGLEYFIDKATYQDGTTLKDNLDEETYDKVLKVLAKFGISEETFAQYKIWSLANNLNVLSISNSESLEQGAQKANLGIDIYFLSNAILQQKPIVELEGIKYQADLFDGLSKNLQLAYLNGILDSILEPKTNETSDSNKLLIEWLNQWIKGDVEGFKKSYSTSVEESNEEQTEFSNMLFGKRDKDMADKIIEILESEEKGTYFVVVGAGHFVLEDSIIYHLTEKGYNVEVFK